jgi:hypothetical protein
MQFRIEFPVHARRRKAQQFGGLVQHALPTKQFQQVEVPDGSRHRCNIHHQPDPTSRGPIVTQAVESRFSQGSLAHRPTKIATCMERWMPNIMHDPLQCAEVTTMTNTHAKNSRCKNQTCSGCLPRGSDACGSRCCLPIPTPKQQGPPLVKLPHMQ